MFCEGSSWRDAAGNVSSSPACMSLHVLAYQRVGSTSHTVDNQTHDCCLQENCSLQAGLQVAGPQLVQLHVVFIRAHVVSPARA